MTLEDSLRLIVDTLQQIASTKTGSVSSVEVKTSARGVDITCKAYTDSDIEPAGNAAVAEYKRVRAMLEDKLMGVASNGPSAAA